MTTVVARCPMRRPGLVIRPLGAKGRYVVKNPQSGTYFELGTEEHFLLQQLDGEQDVDDVCRAFGERFGEPLSAEELDGFVAMAAKQDLLWDRETESRNDGEQNPVDGSIASPLSITPSLRPSVSKPRQSLLHWRRNIFDPDRLFTWLAPKIPFFWTPAFLVVSAGCIALATLIVWTGRHELAGSLRQSLRWETAVLVWLTLLAVTLLHEWAHGLTCKHYGGDVREIGFLLMFFMPCFYCNVSDAWLFPEKSKRLWVTFAGGYFELFLWSLAVFVWRVTVPETLMNGLAFVVLSVCGVQTLFNFNPLLKLDGYYLLSDWVEIPNLRQRALARLKAWLRWLLWGAARPEAERRGRFLVGFGVVSWLYSLTFLGLMLFAMGRFLGDRWGPLGIGAVALLGVVSTRGLFQGLSSGEARTMLLKRHKRTMGWLLGLGLSAGLLFGVEMDDRASGPFELRSALRAEVHAPVAGFLQEVYFDEGEWVSPGSPVARLTIPDLESRLAQKQAELTEAQAKLRLLEIGPRPEEVVAQQQRVARAQTWRDLAEHDLGRQRQALDQELARLDQKIAQCQTELVAARDSYGRARALRARQAISQQEYAEADTRYRVSQTQLEQARAERAARQHTGTLEAEAELARRERNLAAEQSALTLLEAGTRPEQIAAQRAAQDRLQEELKYLQQRREKLLVYSDVPGVITTPRLKEKLGQYLQEGEPICVIEASQTLEAEIALPEQDVSRVQPGQQITLKIRALPFDTFRAHVERIAPAAALKAAAPQPAPTQDVPHTVAVYCRLSSETASLRPGMTGYARISTRRALVGQILLQRVLRYIRTEFWW